MKILMCRPIFFDIEYEINPWMHVDNKVDQKRALSQWQQVFDAYAKTDIQIELIDQMKGLPDMTFTANGAVVYKNKAIISNHRFKERKGEEMLFKRWFVDHGYEVHTLKHHQGGQGDALFFRDTLYMGHGFRSDRQAHEEIQNILNVPAISLKLIDPYFYDFDTAFCPMGDWTVLYYPQAFDLESLEILKNIPDSIALTDTQAKHFVANSVLVENELLTQYVDMDLELKLKKYDIRPRVFEMNEFNKSGGGIKCVSLIL